MSFEFVTKIRSGVYFSHRHGRNNRDSMDRKKTARTPDEVIDLCRRRLKSYDAED